MNDVFDEIVVVKRSGQRVNFDGTKIAVAIKKAFDQVYADYDQKKVNKVYQATLDKINGEYQNRKTIQVEQIQDVIEEVLREQKFIDVYEAFNDYRLKRSASREAFSIKQHHKFVKAIERIGMTIEDSNDAHPMDLMHKFASVMSQEFAQAYLIDSKYVRAHDEGSINIPNLGVYALGITSSACLDMFKITSQSLSRFTDLVLEKINHIKQEQYGEQIISDIAQLYSPIILNEFKDTFYKKLTTEFKLNGLLEYLNLEDIKETINSLNTIYLDFEKFNEHIKNNKVKAIFEETYEMTLLKLKENISNNIKKLLLRLNTFEHKTNNNKVSIGVGDYTKPEEKLCLEIYLKVLEELERLNNVITVYKLSDTTTEEITLQIARLVSDNKNIRFTHNSNDYYLSNGLALLEGQTLNSSITINLARIGIKNINKSLNDYLKDLEDVMELAKNQVMQRFELQANKYKENYKYLFIDNLLLDTNKLEEGQKVRKILRNGLLAIDYVGLCDSICLLKDKKTFELEDIKTAIKIIEFMNKKVEQYTNEHKIKFVVVENNIIKTRISLLAIDKSVYGLGYLLDKKDYPTFSKYIIDLKIDLEEQFKIYNKLNTSGYLVVAFKTQNNTKKIIEYLDNGKNNANYFEIRTGNYDN